MTARATFKQDDVSRLCRGATAAGLQVTRIVVVDGRIEIIIGAGDSADPVGRINPLDEHLHGAKA